MGGPDAVVPARRPPASLPRVAVAGVALALLAACTGLPPVAPTSPAAPAADGPTMATATAQAPQPGSRFAAAEDQLRATAGADASGFRLLAQNQDALRWRLVLIDAATQSLDLQYYVWFGDRVGQLLMARVLAAADRGVRVRLLFDDLNTLLHDMTHVELRDALLARIDGHPNIEIRVFNAWRNRDLLGRAFETGADFGRLNRRMHNKQMVADNRAAIIGGRNIGDEYFGLNDEFNFYDLDVLAVGPAARQASAVFDRYWNSPWVGPVPRGTVALPPGAASDADARVLADLARDPRAQAILAGRRSWEPELAGLPASLKPGRSAVHADSPSRAAASRNHVPDAFRALLRSAQREVLITNAYIIPDDGLVQDLQSLVQRGVAVRVLTNSLASHDVAAVNSHYETWRPRLLAAGVALHELRPDAALKPLLVDTPPVQGRFAGLHAKAMVIDRQRSFVGSMNLDPRSEVVNAEMGVIIDSEPLAQALATAMDRDMSGANSWQLSLGAGGALRWTSDAGVLHRQPARGLGQRLENLFFKLFPPTLY